MMPREIEQIADEVEVAAHQDAVGLWFVCGYFPETDENAAARRAGVLAVCADLIARPTLRCVHFHDGVFHVWPEDGKAMERIARGYDVCSGNPALGDVVWFATETYLHSLIDPPVVWSNEQEDE